MTTGVSLSDEDLEAVRTLFTLKWSADIRNWKERDTDYCLWFVSCNTKNGYSITKTGHSLSQTIQDVLHDST